MLHVKDLFLQDDTFLKVRQESVKALLKDPMIQSLVQKHQLTSTDVSNNWADFLSYQSDAVPCSTCRSFYDCPKVSKGMRCKVDIVDRNVHLSLTPCHFGKERLEEDLIKSRILLCNVDKKIVLTKTSDIQRLMKKEGITNAFASLDKYLQNPTMKGMYLYGGLETGKSLLMGWLIRQLVKQGATCGFIHFPTYLMDLKNSFGEDGVAENLALLKSVDYLVIDDLGNENVTSWSRDEILSAMLSYRMQSGKTTFFTSAYSLTELGTVYTQKNSDALKVKQLLKRIQSICDIVPIVGKSKQL